MCPWYTWPNGNCIHWIFTSLRLQQQVKSTLYYEYSSPASNILHKHFDYIHSSCCYCTKDLSFWNISLHKGTLINLSSPYRSLEVSCYHHCLVSLPKSGLNSFYPWGAGRCLYLYCLKRFVYYLQKCKLCPWYNHNCTHMPFASQWLQLQLKST